MSSELDALMKENRLFPPSEDLKENSNIQRWMERYGITDYNQLLERAMDDPEWFWDELARELEWFQPYKNVLKWDPPHAEWFSDGKFNVVHNALDRHVKTWRKNKVAYIWEGESGQVKKLSWPRSISVTEAGLPMRVLRGLEP